jgi:hypothetical protein
VKKLIVGFVILFLILSCNTYKRDKFVYNLGQGKEQWINNYKTEFFIKCLQYGYQNDSIIKLMSKKDILYYLPNPLEFQHKEIDNLASKIIAEMPKPIYPKLEEDDEKEEFKKQLICANCLNYYASKELDSIAKISYTKSIKKLKSPN